MPKAHWHVSIDHVVAVTVMSVVGWNVLRLLAAEMVKRGKDGGIVDRSGQALGALVK